LSPASRKPEGAASPAISPALDKKWIVFVLFALLLGAALRLCLPGDIEYKDDEKVMFDMTQAIRTTGTWPPLGVRTGVGGRHPAMGVWVFGAWTKILPVSSPPELARGGQILNILALCLLAFYSLRLTTREEREAWLWATVFAAVNPFLVLLQRKIWIPSLLPFFCMLFWMGWRFRHKWPGAFAWGLLGILLGQIHMSGFFLSGAVFLWTIWKEREVKWGAWLMGTLVGLPPLLPWIQFVFTNHENGFSKFNGWWVFYPKYWFYWATDPLGLGLNYSLKTRTFMDFIRYPLLGDHGTYLVGLLHLLIGALGILILLAWKKNRGKGPAVLDSSETGKALKVALGPAGLLMTLSCIEVCRHYLLMAFPLEGVWLSRMGLCDHERGRWRLACLWAAELLLTLLFLYFIHVNHGAPIGDYGVAYQYQAQPAP